MGVSDEKVWSIILSIFCLTHHHHLATNYLVMAASDDGDKNEPKWLSLNDPTSFSNPEEVRADRIHIHWDVNFDRKILEGVIHYELIVNGTEAQKIIFDVHDLKIKSVTDVQGQNLTFSLGPPYKTMGQPLTVNLSTILAHDGDKQGLTCEIKIVYETSPRSAGLHWLEKEMTADKKLPFLFSQSSLINARAVLPCQDTPATKSVYTATITAPPNFVVLFGGLSTSEPQPEFLNGTTNGTRLIHKFEQKIPIPSYLVAIAVGRLESAVVGPRSKVWAEKSLLGDATFDFSETESMIEAAESIVGAYAWGRYDILVLPPSFPFGGMENPTITFTTPALLTHDRSLSDVIAHEIAHSWMGNLVTHKNFQHFWLKEGFTVYLERKIVGILKGEKERQFESIAAFAELNDTVNTLGSHNPFTKLVTDLRGIHPNDAFTSVPYEKGFIFLYYFETLVGSTAMEAYLRHFVQKFRGQSIDSEEMKQDFIQYFEKEGKHKSIEEVDWDDWFYGTGMPKWTPSYDRTLYNQSEALSFAWQEWSLDKRGNPFSINDLGNLSPGQIQAFLTSLLASGEPLPLEKIKAMEQTYKFNGYRNAEIYYRWLRLCIQSRWREQYPRALKFVNEMGRLKYVRPIYRDLYEWAEFREETMSNFEWHRPSMMLMSVRAIAKVLHLDQLLS